MWQSGNGDGKGMNRKRVARTGHTFGSAVVPNRERGGRIRSGSDNSLRRDQAEEKQVSNVFGRACMRVSVLAPAKGAGRGCCEQ